MPLLRAGFFNADRPLTQAVLTGTDRPLTQAVLTSDCAHTAVRASASVTPLLRAGFFNAFSVLLCRSGEGRAAVRELLLRVIKCFNREVRVEVRYAAKKIPT